MRLIHHENLLICMKGFGSNQMLLIIKDNNPPDPHRFHIPPSLTSCDNSSQSFTSNWAAKVDQAHTILFYHIIKTSLINSSQRLLEERNSSSKLWKKK